MSSVFILQVQRHKEYRQRILHLYKVCSFSLIHVYCTTSRFACEIPNVVNLSCFEILFLEFCWNNIEQTAMICVLGICLFMLGVLCVMLRLFCMWSLLPWNVLDWISLGRHTGYLNSENYIDKDFTSRMLCNYWLHGWSSSQYAIIWVSELASN